MVNRESGKNTLFLLVLVDLNVQNNNQLQRQDNNGSLDDSCYYNLSETFLEKQFLLIGKHSSSGLLHRGHYLLPFRLALPPDLPSTFHYRGFGLHGRIIYTLEVEVTVAALLKRNLRSEPIEVAVRQLTREPVMPLQKVIDDLFMPSFWCFGGGTMVDLAVALDKNYYAPGDKILLKFAINSPVNTIKYAQVSLVRCVRIGTADRSRWDEKVLGCSTVKRIKGCLERRAQFLLPESTPFSVQGRQLIECHYEIRFKVRAYWCFSKSFVQRIVVNDTLLPSYEMATITNK